MRWTTLLQQPAQLISAPTVFRSGEAIINSRPTSQKLFESWELNHWNPYEIDFEVDRGQWNVLPSLLKARIESVIRTFVIGEYTGLDLLSPVLAGATSESGLRFLATQVADEARHSVFMFQLLGGLWGEDGRESVLLDQAWSGLTPAYRQLNELERELARATLLEPSSYDKWIRQVAMFHLVTEGVLAYYGQHALTRTLDKGNLLPGVKQGFLAMGRDEARHISFGMEMIREALSEHRRDEILETLVSVLPLAICVDYDPRNRSEGMRREADRSRKALSSLAARRLTQAGLGRDLVVSFMREIDVHADKFLERHGFCGEV